MKLFYRIISCSSLILFLLPAKDVCSQSKWPLFCVYEVQGNVVLQKPSSAEISKIKKTQFINSGEIIMIKDDNSELILFDKDTNYITLNKKGSYTTDAVLKYKKEHLKDGITIKYSSFFWKEFFKPEKLSSLENAEEIAKSSGGVSRGLIQIISPSSNYQTSMDELLFKWKKINGAHVYSFVITDKDGKNYYRNILADTLLLVHFHDSLPYGNLYRWSLGFVSNTIAEIEPFTGQLELVDEEKILPLLQLNSPYSLQGVLRGLQYAELYEENGCIKKAYLTYKSLIEKNPGDKSLKALFISFKKNNYITEN
jgi:hypothetical protein